MPARFTDRKRGRANFYRSGDNNLIDDRSGFKIKASTSRKEWNGFLVRKESWEQRQPQDLLRGFPDKQAAQISRTGNADVFLDPNSVKPSDL